MVPEHDFLNQPVYRIFSLSRFKESLQSKQLVLLPPRKWEDPFEWLPEGMIVDKRTNPWKETSVADFLKPAFAQCWSRTCESDTLLRAYSRVSIDPTTGRNRHPEVEGVQVRSTPSKLLQALVAWAGTDRRASCFIGPVKYLPEDKIWEALGFQVRRAYEQAHWDAEERARLLLLKRPAFQHEAEVRVIYVEQQDVPCPESICIPIDPTMLFDEVTFDPRLITFERLEREQTARELGYGGRITPQDLYQRYLLEIIIDDSTG